MKLWMRSTTSALQRSSIAAGWTGLACFVIVCCIDQAAYGQRSRPLDPLARQLQPERSIVYSTVAGRELKLHLFEPDGYTTQDRRSVFLIVHGGGWTGGFPWRCYPFADHFRRQGMLGISIEYRLLNSPQGTTVFDCVRDGRSAVRYLRQNATQLGIDPQKITVAGCSAGGHVAAGTALFDDVDDASDATDVSSVPDAMVLYYPVIDTSAEGYGQKKIGDRWRQLSPVHHVRGKLPPTLIFHGTADTVTPFAGAEMFQKEMHAAGNDCQLISHPGGVHGYLIFDLSLFEASMNQTRTFLQTHDMLPHAGNGLSSNVPPSVRGLHNSPNALTQ